MAHNQGLSESEIDIEDDLDEEGNPTDELAGDDDTDDEDTDTETKVDPAAEDEDDDTDDEPPAKVSKPAPAAAPAAAPVAAPAVDDRPFVPQYTVEAPADADAKITALRGEELKALKDYSDGLIEHDAYLEIRSRTDGEIDSIRRAVIKAEVFAEANKQAQDQIDRAEWNRAESAAMKEAKASGIDFDKPALLAMRNYHLGVLAALPENATKDAAWFLGEATKLVQADIGAPVKQTTKQRGTRLDELPPTLRDAPAAQITTESGNEFAHMDRLSGVDLEKAFAKLTPEQQDRYLEN